MNHKLLYRAEIVNGVVGSLNSMQALLKIMKRQHITDTPNETVNKTEWGFIHVDY